MLSLIFVLLAGIFKAVMDTLQFHFDSSIFASSSYQKWNPSISWKNKWKNGDQAQGEKFLGSSTVFVLFTDAWHLFQFFFLTMLMAAVCLYKPMVNPLVDFFILKIALTASFELFFSKIFIKGK